MRVMARRVWVGAGGLLLFVGMGCAGQRAAYNPFVVPKTQITNSVRTIALAPLVVAEGLDGADPQRGKFDSLLSAELQAAGYAVVPSEEAGMIWARVRDSLGGLFNPTTGQRDSVKFAQARVLAMAELRTRFRADALLHPFIVIGPARFDAGTAEWDGTSQSYQSTGKKLLAALFGGETYGRAPALSVQVLMEDMTGRDLYANRGGLQLYAVPSGKDFVPVPVQELYTDPARNALAVHLALAPLIGPAEADRTGH